MYLRIASMIVGPSGTVVKTLVKPMILPVRSSKPPLMMQNMPEVTSTTLI